MHHPGGLLNLTFSGFRFLATHGVCCSPVRKENLRAMRVVTHLLMSVTSILSTRFVLLFDCFIWSLLISFLSLFLLQSSGSLCSLPLCHCLYMYISMRVSRSATCTSRVFPASISKAYTLHSAPSLLLTLPRLSFVTCRSCLHLPVSLLLPVSRMLHCFLPNIVFNLPSLSFFGPCADVSARSLSFFQVKQIVGGTLTDGGALPATNHVSTLPAAHFATLYRDDKLPGGHVIQLGEGNDTAAREALQAWPNGLHLGGGVTDKLAPVWIEAGAEKVGPRPAPLSIFRDRY